jgi:hypothetical protein
MVPAGRLTLSAVVDERPVRAVLEIGVVDLAEGLGEQAAGVVVVVGAAVVKVTYTPQGICPARGDRVAARGKLFP